MIHETLPNENLTSDRKISQQITPETTDKDIEQTYQPKPKKSVFSNIKKFFGITSKQEIIKTDQTADKQSTVTPVKNSKSMWVPDEKALTCYNCQKIFSTLFLRKHHCRICGNVFCKECS